jgi:hypothetical protein
MTRQAGPVFTARRAVWATLLNALMGVLLSALTITNLVHQLREGGSWPVAALFVVLSLFFLWQGWMQLRDRAPVIEIGPRGLLVPTASPEILPWPRLRHVAPGRGLPGLGGGRIDFTVDSETFARLKLGQRFMGDVAVKARGRPNTVSLITSQLDENADSIFAAVKRYWPAESDDEDQDREE